MKQKYEIKHWQDDQYAVYTMGEYNDYLFKGTLEEVNAWISLKEKGYDI